MTPDGSSVPTEPRTIGAERGRAGRGSPSVLI